MRAGLGGAAYARGDGWQAARLLYAGRQLAMTVIVPDGARLDELERSLDGPVLASILGSLAPVEYLDLTLPRWRFRTSAMLNSVLADLGMVTAFSDRADFSAMTSQDRLKVDAMLHDAFIAVDEQGTEAAAATAVVMTDTSMPVPTELRVDRAFLFVLHDVETAAPLFIGRVDDPTSD
jgi:serine protease inhibitor